MKQKLTFDWHTHTVYSHGKGSIEDNVVAAVKKGLKAIIVSERSFERYRRKNYNILGATGRISKTKINLMTVYESKGLEFTSVAVADADMAPHEKYIAYTRALKELAIVEEHGNAE